MQRVVSINLNGNVYQLEENGYNALFAYLDATETQLKDNPNRAQMLADIERAIAEKCQACFAPHKTVITSGEIDRIISEMEPVASQPANAANAARAQGSPGPGTGEKTRTESQAHKRLYQIREGGIIGGVCLGLATFFNIDVTVVRIVFVLFAVATGGWGILAYAALMYILPRATTREQAESTSNAPPQWPWDRDGWLWDRDGWPWDRHSWPWDRHGWPWDREQKRAWRYEQRAARWGYGGSPPGGTLVIVICVILGFAWLSFWMRGGVLFGGPFFWGGPFVWGFPPLFGILLFLMLFRFLFLPHRAARWGWYGHPGYGPYPHGAWLVMWNSVIWLGTMIFVGWLAYHYIPDVHDFIQQFGTDWSDARFRV